MVDDDVGIRKLLKRYLAAEGYAVDAAGDGEQMKQALAQNAYDLVILDLLMPGENGLSLARELRSSSNIPLIMLSGKDDLVDKIVGLELGADDYVTKPFDRRELLARIRSVLRRADAKSETEGSGSEFRSVVHFAGWQLDLAGHELTAPDGERVHLTSYEFQVLAVLAQRPTRSLSRDQILDLVADRNWQPFDRSIDVLVAKLRRKLRDDPRNPRFIKTVRGMGYMFMPRTESE